MILSRTRKTLSIYLRIFKQYGRIKPFLPVGVYRVEVVTSKERPLLSLPIFLIKIRKSNKEIFEKNTRLERKISFYLNTKTVTFIGDKVITLYYNYKVPSNIKQWIDYISYPRTKFYDVSSSGNYSVTNYIVGERHFDKDHILRLAQDLLSAAVNAFDFEKPEKYRVLDDDNFKNIRYSIQHGDFGPLNVLWVNDENYYVIDFDNIEIYSTFYDFLYLISRGQTGLFEGFVNGIFDEKIKNYMFSRGIDESIESFKDECIAAFVMAHHTAAIEIRCKMIRKYIPGTYIKTREALAVAESRH